MNEFINRKPLTASSANIILFLSEFMIISLKVSAEAFIKDIMKDRRFAGDGH